MWGQALRTTCLHGDGTFELSAAMKLWETVTRAKKGRPKLGVKAYAYALPIVPKTHLP